MNAIDKLTELFSHFPGIGPRQAKRFVYFLLYRRDELPSDLARALQNLHGAIDQCERCRRFFPKSATGSHLCTICSDASRDATLLMIVPRDVDLESVERSKSFRGLYFVLGGQVPILEKEPEKRIRLADFRKRVTDDPATPTEIILAMNATNEGENTADFLRQEIAHLAPNISVSVLGRGLSTGAELEYADPETLKNALLHRTK